MCERVLAMAFMEFREIGAEGAPTICLCDDLVSGVDKQHASPATFVAKLRTGELGLLMKRALVAVLPHHRHCP